MILVFFIIYHPLVNTILRNMATELEIALSKLVPDVSTQKPISSKEDAFLKAKELLHVNRTPESLKCRTDEYVEIYSQLASSIIESTGSCIYIAGVPGTGKTATVTAVLKHLRLAVNSEEIPRFDSFMINGMKLSEPTQAYSKLWEYISGERHPPQYACNQLSKYFTKTCDVPTIVVVDELDLLVNRNQTVMYNFFDWPNNAGSKLIVIAIANTMDLPERILTNRVSSRLGLTRIGFLPYTYLQLIEIIKARVEGLDIFNRDAIEFCARKIGSISGDARRALDICRRAVEISSHKVHECQHVEIDHINTAIKEMFDSPVMRYIKTLSESQQLFLIAIIRCCRRMGHSEVPYNDVMQEYIRLCKYANRPLPTCEKLATMLSCLSSCHIILSEGKGSADLFQKLRLNVAEEDIKVAVGCEDDKEWLKKVLKKWGEQLK